MELMVTIAVLGVIAGLAVPTYQRTVAQSRGNEALINLNIIDMAERVYFMNNANQYLGDGAVHTIGEANLPANLNTDMTSQFYNQVVITANNGAIPPNYVATITCTQGCSGTPKSFTFTYPGTNAADIAANVPTRTEGGTY